MNRREFIKNALGASLVGLAAREAILQTNAQDLARQAGGVSAFSGGPGGSDDPLRHVRLHAISDALEHSGISVSSPKLGDRLFYDGANWVNKNPINQVDLVDEFFAGTNETGEIGELGWNSQISSGSIITSREANHPGIYILQTLGAAGNYAGISFSNSSIDMGDLYDLYSIMKTGSNLTSLWRFGMSNSMVPTQEIEAIMFEYDSDLGDTNWMAVTAIDYATQVWERTDTGIAVTTGTWYRMRIRRLASSVEFYINDVLVATNTQELPSGVNGVGEFGYIVVNRGTTPNKSLPIDFFRVQVGVTR